MIDRMDCLGKSVLGLTHSVPKCHNHKFDPLTQEEYYRLFAYLNNDYESISDIYTHDQFKESPTFAAASPTARRN